MEIDNHERNKEKLIESVLYKKLKYKKDYLGQRNNPIVDKWKTEIIKKYGKGGQFYYCKLDELYYYADEDEAIYYKRCPNCNKYCCPYCYESMDYYSGIGSSCIKGRINYIFLYNIYEYISPKLEDRRDKEPRKPDIINYIPFISMCNLVATCSVTFFWKLDRYKNGENISDYELRVKNYHCVFLSVFILNNCFGFFISIPYFLYHYILIAILGIISIFNKKPLFGYCAVIDRGMSSIYS